MGCGKKYRPSDMSLQAFWQFFDVEIHDMVLDMEEAENDGKSCVRQYDVMQAYD